MKKWRDCLQGLGTLATTATRFRSHARQALLAATALTVTTFLPSIGGNAADLAPIVSGLPWRSGASFCNGKDPNWVTWRDRELDIVHQFTEHKTWEEMHYKIGSGSNLKNAIAGAPQVSVDLAPWPNSLGYGHLDECANGDYDAHFKQFGADLVKRGAGTAIIRIGHEPTANEFHVWGIFTLQDAQDWKACFRNIVTALKDDSTDAVKGGRQFKIEWNNARRGKIPFSVMETYPGDDIVDIWGLNVYDRGPDVTPLTVTKKQPWATTWEKFYMKTLNGGPFGIGAWLAEAKKHGKPIALTEWGNWAYAGRATPADNPLFIQTMFDFFKTNAADIAYETYWACPLKHRVGPPGTSNFPNASLTYKTLWGSLTSPLAKSK